jgi:hypothetical protein
MVVEPARQPLERCWAIAAGKVARVHEYGEAG